jgi:hypothetical protein
MNKDASDTQIAAAETYERLFVPAEFWEWTGAGCSRKQRTFCARVRLPTGASASTRPRTS